MEEALCGQKLLWDCIPQKFEAIGEMLARLAWNRPEPTWCYKSTGISLPITWTYQDVLHQFGATSENCS